MCAKFDISSYEMHFSCRWEGYAFTRGWTNFLKTLLQEVLSLLISIANGGLYMAIGVPGEELHRPFECSGLTCAL